MTRAEGSANALGVYVHWPFCARICPYCDFNVYRDRGIDADAWSSALAREIKTWAGRIEPRPLQSLYFGGGTPSRAPSPVIETVIDRCAAHFGFDSDAEITLEANPNDVSPDAVAAWRAVGINRLSLGVQSFRDEALAFLGRDHDADAARRALVLARQAFSNLTFDLIYGRRDQSAEDWARELDEALAFAPPHLSLYQLTIEEGTAFGKAVSAGRWRPPGDEICAAQYEIAQAATRAAGLAAYEVSNHAAPGFESRHNLLYWRYRDYLGLGPGAHGRIIVDGARMEQVNLDRPDAYLEAVAATGHGAASLAPLDEEAQLVERLSMGLRLSEGTPLYADDYFYTDEDRAARLEALIDGGWLTLSCGTLRASSIGRPVLNRLVYELLG